MTKSEMTHFWHHWLFVSMPVAKESKILIKIVFSIKDYNAKDLIKEFPSKEWNVGLVYKLLQKLRIAGSSSIVPAAADDAAPAQLITLNLFTNLYRTNMTKQKNNICTLYLITCLLSTKKISKLVGECWKL